MPTSVARLFKEASHLDEGDRAALAGLLLESLDQPPIAGVEAAWAEEIERRRLKHCHGKTSNADSWRGNRPAHTALFFPSFPFSLCIAWPTMPSRC